MFTEEYEQEWDEDRYIKIGWREKKRVYVCVCVCVRARARVFQNKLVDKEICI